MSVVVQATATVGASPREVLKFVLDLASYSEVDAKIVRVLKITGPDERGRGAVILLGRLPGLPLPPAPDKQPFVLDRWTSIEFRGARRQPARLVFEFVGRVVCRPLAGGGTEVTHSYDLALKGPFRRFERRIQQGIEKQISEEMRELELRFPASDPFPAESYLHATPPESTPM